MEEETKREQAETQQQQAETHEENSEVKKSNKKAVIIAVVCVVIAALIACGVCLFVKNEQDHAASSISFTFEAANYDSQTGSGIPVYIEGTDLDGNEVADLVLVDEGNSGVELLRGEYDISVIGSPVNADGGIYTTSEGVIHLVIGEGDVVANDESLSRNEDGTIELPVIAFTAIKAKDVTDKQIDAIKTWMIDIGFSGELVTKFENLIVENRKAGIKQAEEEALAAWRTKISGEFGGSGAASAPPAGRAMFYLDGDKLTVRGKLGNLSGSEWHFVLTDNTEYGWSDEFYHSETRAEFVRSFPDQFVAITIDVKDGYVISMRTHA